MSDEKRQILTMLAEKKITVDEAERLLQALGGPQKEKRETEQSVTSKHDSEGRKAKYMYISIKPKEGGKGKSEKVNIKVPLFLLRTGLKFGGVLPDSAKEKINKAFGEKGIDIGKLDSEAFEELVEGLGDLAISIDDEDEKVSIYCE